MTGLFQFTVRLAIETEARFTSVQRIIDYSQVWQPRHCFIVIILHRKEVNIMTTYVLIMFTSFSC